MPERRAQTSAKTGGPRSPTRTAGLLLLAVCLAIAFPAAAWAQDKPLQKRLSGGYLAVQVGQGQTLASLAEAHLGGADHAWRIAEFNGVSSVSPGDTVVIPLREENPGGVRPGRYQTVPVLSYHKFSEQPADGKTTVSRAQFERQMQHLADNGYTVVTLDALLDFMAYERPLPSKAVAITIDDGWRSTYEIAYPVLKRHGFPATLFVYTGLIAEQGGKLAMTWEQIRELADNGIDVQCQSRSHRNFAKPRDNENFESYFRAIDAELTETARVLKEKVGADCRFLSYPYGQTNPLVIAVAKQHDLRGAFTLRREASPFFADPYRIGRAMIFNDFDLEDFKENLVVSSSEALQ